MNIGQIAKRAGVSRSTVSYALSGKRPVSAATRQRIQEVIAELGYRPNAAARALKEGRTRTLGLVIPPASTQLTHVQLNFVASVVEASARADLDVLLSPSGGDHDSSFERLLAGGRVDGVILMEIRLEDSRVDRLQEAGLPFVGIGHTSRADDMCWIDIDYAKLISQSVHHLVDLGHTHIALISRSPELLAAGYGPAHRALDGFTAALAERNIEGVDYPCGDDTRAGEECMRRLLNEHPEITAVTTINEAALPGIQHTLEIAGLKIPRDFSITGVAAKTWAEDFRPPLTTADVPAHEIGAQAVQLLIERIANPQTPHRHILMRPPISLRSSTGPVRNHRATTLPSRSKPRNSA